MVFSSAITIVDLLSFVQNSTSGPTHFHRSVHRQQAEPERLLHWLAHGQSAAALLH